VTVKGTLREEQACDMGKRACEEIICLTPLLGLETRAEEPAAALQHYAGSSIHLQTD